MKGKVFLNFILYTKGNRKTGTIIFDKIFLILPTFFTSVLLFLETSQEERLWLLLTAVSGLGDRHAHNPF
jgi:hypothetical protein